MDGVVKWLTVTVAARIVQLHHSHPMYEHMMNDGFNLKLHVIFLFIILILFVLVILW